MILAHLKSGQISNFKGISCPDENPTVPVGSSQWGRYINHIASGYLTNRHSHGKIHPCLKLGKPSISMGNFPCLQLGKPSISMGHLYHGELLNKQRYFVQIGRLPLGHCVCSRTLTNKKREIQEQKKAGQRWFNRPKQHPPSGFLWLIANIFHHQPCHNSLHPCIVYENIWGCLKLGYVIQPFNGGNHHNPLDFGWLRAVIWTQVSRIQDFRVWVYGLQS